MVIFTFERNTAIKPGLLFFFNVNNGVFAIKDIYTRSFPFSRMQIMMRHLLLKIIILVSAM